MLRNQIANLGDIRNHLSCGITGAPPGSGHMGLVRSRTDKTPLHPTTPASSPAPRFPQPQQPQVARSSNSPRGAVQPRRSQDMRTKRSFRARPRPRLGLFAQALRDTRVCGNRALSGIRKINAFQSSALICQNLPYPESKTSTRRDPSPSSDTHQI